MYRTACWGCLLLGVGLLGCSGAQSQETKPPPPPEVFYKLPLSVTVTDHEDFTGHTQAVKTVTVRARVQGYLVKVNFLDGAMVKKGDVLFEIDPRPYQDQVDSSLGQVASLDALHKQAAADNKRFKELAAKSPGAVTGQDLDKYEYADQQSAANLASAKAALQQNELNLSFTKVVADTDGRISNHMIDVGNLVLSDNTPLTTIVTQDPVWAYFDIDEHTWLRIDRIVKHKQAESPGKHQTEVNLGLIDEVDKEGLQLFPHQGSVNFVDNQVDMQTGTIRMRGEFSNQSGMLTPGLFVRIRLPIGDPHSALVIPERALQSDQGRRFVFVVSSKDVIEYRPVSVGDTYPGEMRVIEDGLQSGDRVVTSGLQRVKPGATVTAKPDEMQDQPATPAGKTSAQPKAEAPAVNITSHGAASPAANVPAPSPSGGH